MSAPMVVERRPIPTKVELEKRRTLIAAMLERGYSMRQIVEQLHAHGYKLSLTQVHYDCQLILRRYNEEQLQNAEQWRGRLHQRNETLYRTAATIAASVDAPPAVRLFAVETARKITESQAKLLGVAAPTKLEISGPEGGPIPWGHVLMLIPESIRNELWQAPTDRVAGILERASETVPELIPVARRLKSGS